MTIPIEDLAYETHLYFYRHNISGDIETDAYWYFQAQKLHCYSVLDASLDIHTQILSLGQIIGPGEAYHHLVFGAGRRSKMIWVAFRELFGIIQPDRKQPLPHDQVAEAARALNDIYIHMRGMLDNFAWTIAQLFGDDDLKSLHQNDIGFFARKFRRNGSISDFIDITEPFSDWEREIKERRDPIAHRIPLSVPPSILTADDHELYAEKQREWSEANAGMLALMQSGGSMEEIDAASSHGKALFRELDNIGTFVPIIIHNPDDGGVKIYPTVPEDMGKLVNLSRQLLNLIGDKIRA